MSKQKAEFAHRHAPGIWCDECPDADAKRAAIAASEVAARSAQHALTLRLDEPVWLRLRQRAHDEHRSISDLIREAVDLRYPPGTRNDGGRP